MTIANIEISNFVRGLITEASLLSFPEGASLDELNMKLLNDGTRERRLGLNRELNGVVHDTELTDEDLRDLRVSYHDWPMPNNNPRLHIGAIQIGAKLWFIDVTKPNPSAHLLNGGASIAADVVGDVAVISTYINGNLLLTSVSFGTPVLLLYNEDTDTVSSVSAPILIRDLSGVHDGLAINERPNTLSSEHLYNLRNQGWSDDIVVASIAEEQHIGFPEGVGASSGNITVGGIIVAVISSDTAWDVATKIAATINNQITDNATFPVRADANGTNVLRIFYDKRDGNVAQIAVVDASTLLAAVPISNTAVHGVDNSAVTAITAVFTKLGVYPSNSDLVQLGMIPDLTDPDVYSFDADVWYQNSHLSTGEAPKGHYVIDAFNRKASREAVSGISPLVSDIELGRLGVCTTYAGRVFYGGVLSRISDADSRSRNASGTLYFGQIGASLNTLVNAYQQFDPTNKDLNELLPTDGGTIEITGCSVQTRMISSEGSLFVFTERGIWEIKGGENGFTATEFSVNKISNIGVISPYSIVEINGVFMFWAREGIYRLSRNQFGRWESTSMTIPTIQTMFNSITDEAKRHVKGYFDLSKHQVRWMYHSSGAKVVGSHAVPPPAPAPNPLPPPDVLAPAFLIADIYDDLGVVNIHGYTNIDTSAGEHFATQEYMVTTMSSSTYTLTGAEGISFLSKAGEAKTEYLHYYNYTGPSRYLYRFEPSSKVQQVAAQDVTVQYAHLTTSLGLTYGQENPATLGDPSYVGVVNFNPATRVNTILNFTALDVANFPASMPYDIPLHTRYLHYTLGGHLKIDNDRIVVRVQADGRVSEDTAPNNILLHDRSQGYVIVSRTGDTANVGIPFWYQRYKQDVEDGRFSPVHHWITGGRVFAMGPRQGKVFEQLFALTIGAGLTLTASQGYFTGDGNTLRSVDWWLDASSEQYTYTVTGMPDSSAATLFTEPALSADAYLSRLVVSSQTVEGASVPNMVYGSVGWTLPNARTEIVGGVRKFLPPYFQTNSVARIHQIGTGNNVWLTYIQWEDTYPTSTFSRGSRVVTAVYNMAL